MCIVVPRISFIYPGHFEYQVLKRCYKLSIEENVTGPAIKIFPFLLLLTHLGDDLEFWQSRADVPFSQHCLSHLNVFS